MPKHTALMPIKHDGKHYDVGDQVSLTAKEAAILIAAGVIDTDRDAAADKAAADKAAADKAAADKAAADKAAAEGQG